MAACAAKICHIVCLLIIIRVDFTSNADGGGRKYQMRFETFDDIDKKLKNPLKKASSKWQDHYFYKFDVDKRKRTCIEAQVHKDSVFVEMSDLDEEHVPQLYELMVDKKGFQSTLVIQCKTVPTAYLYFDETNEEIVVFTESNNFVQANFLIDISQLHPKTCIEKLKQNPNNFDMRSSKFDDLIESECKANQRLETSFLSILKPEKRLNLCLAATWATSKRTRPLFIDNKVGEAELNTFISSSYKEEVRVSILCPTTPPMFIYFRNLRENEDMVVVIPYQSRKSV